MKKIIPFFFIVALIAAVASCHCTKGKQTVQQRPAGDTVVRQYNSVVVKNPKEIDLGNGLKYTVTSQGNGPLPKRGQKIVVLYTGKYTNDTVFDASYKYGYKPAPFHLGRQEVIPGWDSVFSHLHAGDKATMTVPPQYGYGAKVHGSIPANSTLIFDVEVITIGQPWNAAGKDTITTKSGLKMILLEAHPDGVMPVKGNMVSVHYSGYLLDGQMFDSSFDRGQPYTYPLGGQVIAGWNEGLALMHKGEKAKLIIPYALGYGAQGRLPLIPPKATLVFDVQLVDVK
jgi:peptidylprolyl isomerase